MFYSIPWMDFRRERVKNICVGFSVITNLFNINILTFTDTVFTINYSFIILRNYLKKKRFRV